MSSPGEAQKSRSVLNAYYFPWPPIENTALLKKAALYFDSVRLVSISDARQMNVKAGDPSFEPYSAPVLGVFAAHTKDEKKRNLLGASSLASFSFMSQYSPWSMPVSSPSFLGTGPLAQL